jgi:transposase
VTPHWRRRFTPIAEANGDTAAMPSRIWPAVHRELKRKHVTLLIVWDEYVAANPGGYSYSRFCELYRGFEAKLSPTMRQTHAAGERLFVDYAGDGVPVVVDRLTGEVRMAQIFVAVLGASSFTFAHASWTQALPDWIDAHVRALEAIGGVPQSATRWSPCSGSGSARRSDQQR